LPLVLALLTPRLPVAVAPRTEALAATDVPAGELPARSIAKAAALRRTAPAVAATIATTVGASVPSPCLALAEGAPGCDAATRKASAAAGEPATTARESSAAAKSSSAASTTAGCDVHRRRDQESRGPHGDRAAHHSGHGCRSFARRGASTGICCVPGAGANVKRVSGTSGARFQALRSASKRGWPPARP